MSKFIELTDYEGTKVYFNVDNISCFFWSDEEGGETKVFMTGSDDVACFIKETPAEIMAKIQGMQKDEESRLADKQHLNSLDETYIEWLRTKVALYKYVVPNEDKPDVDKQLVQDAEMFERIADRLERLG